MLEALTSADIQTDRERKEKGKIAGSVSDKE